MSLCKQLAESEWLGVLVPSCGWQVTAAILKHCGPLPEEPSAVAAAVAAGKAELPAVAYMLMNEAVVDKFDPVSAKFYISKHLIRMVRAARGGGTT